jgi:hypothetical protein
MIIRAKGFELMIIAFVVDLNTFGSKNVFDLENYELKKCAFNKSYSCLCDRRHECIIYMV